MKDNGQTQGALPSLNDMITGNEQEPNQVTYTTIKEQPDSTTKIVKTVTTSQQPVTETTSYTKKVITTTTTRGNQGPLTQTNSSSRYSNTNTATSSNRNQANSYSRPTTQTNKTTTTTTTTTVQRGQYGQNSRNPNTNSSQTYRGNQKNVKSPTKIGTSQSYAGNKNQSSRPQQSTSYKPKAKSPQPGSLKRKTINRGKPVENVQITHIIYSSGPAEFHITENLNLDNLNSAPIEISKTDRERLQKNGKVFVSCSCDNVDIKPKKANLKGKTLIYQHAQGIGMTNDKKENLNPLFYSSEIKKLNPISKLKEKEIIENVEVFRSNGKVFNSPSPNKTASKTATKTTTTYNRNTYNNQSKNYRSGATNSSTTRGVMGSSTSGRGGNTLANNRGGAGTNVKTTTTYTRGSNMGSGGGDGEIIKDTKTKVQMGSRSYKNTSQPIVQTTTERKVYTQKNFFNK